ncbi:hypothetical protein J583_1281 [Acinetobacter baumannii 83444]|nr:hypothetical protein J583_1281 [Acinetobacter baumannii 83444]
MEMWKDWQFLEFAPSEMKKEIISSCLKDCSRKRNMVRGIV